MPLKNPENILEEFDDDQSFDDSSKNMTSGTNAMSTNFKKSSMLKIFPKKRF